MNFQITSFSNLQISYCLLATAHCKLLIPDHLSLITTFIIFTKIE